MKGDFFFFCFILPFTKLPPPNVHSFHKIAITKCISSQGSTGLTTACVSPQARSMPSLGRLAAVYAYQNQSPLWNSVSFRTLEASIGPRSTTQSTASGTTGDSPPPPQLSRFKTAYLYQYFIFTYISCRTNWMSTFSYKKHWAPIFSPRAVSAILEQSLANKLFTPPFKSLVLYTLITFTPPQLKSQNYSVHKNICIPHFLPPALNSLHCISPVP